MLPNTPTLAQIKHAFPVKGEPVISFPDGDINYPVVERRMGETWERARLPYGTAETDTANFPGLILTDQSVVSANRNNTEVWRRWQRIPGPIQIRQEIDGETQTPVIITSQKVRNGGLFTTAAGTQAYAVSANYSTDEFTATGHGISNLMLGYFTVQGGSAPAGLSTGFGVLYYVRNVTADTFQVSVVSNGSVVNMLNSGTGTLTFHVQTLLLSSISHGITDDAAIQLLTDGTLPTGLSPLTNYVVTVIDADSFSVRIAGALHPIILSNAGTGRHLWRYDWLVPFHGTDGKEVTVETPDALTSAAHGLSNTTLIQFSSTGTLPDGIVNGQSYYVISATTDTFKVSLTSGGTPITITGIGIGIHSWFKVSDSGTFTVIIQDALTSGVHGLVDDDVITLTTDGTLPAGLLTETDYHVVSAALNTFKLSLTEGGSAVDVTGVGTGTHSWSRVYTPVSCTADYTTDAITSTAHGLTTGQYVSFLTDDTLPSGLLPDIHYYVTVGTADEFSVQLSSEGYDPIDILDNGVGSLQWLLFTDPKTFTATATTLISSTAHGLFAGQAIGFSTGGILPSPLLWGVAYYVASPTANTFSISTAHGGPTVGFIDAGTGTHRWFKLTTSHTCTYALSNVLLSAAHGLSEGRLINFSTTGTLPSGLDPRLGYFLRDVTTDSFKVSERSGGTEITLTNTGAGTHRWMLATTPLNVAGNSVSFVPVNYYYGTLTIATLMNFTSIVRNEYPFDHYSQPELIFGVNAESAVSSQGEIRNKINWIKRQGYSRAAKLIVTSTYGTEHQVAAARNAVALFSPRFNTLEYDGWYFNVRQGGILNDSISIQATGVGSWNGVNETFKADASGISASTYSSYYAGTYQPISAKGTAWKYNLFRLEITYVRLE